MTTEKSMDIKAIARLLKIFKNSNKYCYKLDHVIRIDLSSAEDFNHEPFYVGQVILLDVIDNQLSIYLNPNEKRDIMIYSTFIDNQNYFIKDTYKKDIIFRVLCISESKYLILQPWTKHKGEL